MTDIETQGDVRVRVKGMRQTARALQEAGYDLEDLRDALHRIGGGVSDSIQQKAPALTGRLQASVRQSNAKTKAVVRAGGARLVYVPIINYGGYNNIVGQHFMERGLSAKAQWVVSELEKEINEIISKGGTK